MEDNKNNHDNLDNNEDDIDKVKIVVSSLKEDSEINNIIDNMNVDNLDNDVNDSVDKKAENKNKSNEHKNDEKIGFFKTIYYSTIRLDKIDKSIESKLTWKKYIVLLVLIISIILGIFVGLSLIHKIEHIKDIVKDLPEIEYKNGEIHGDVDVIFKEEDISRLVILNTVDDIYKVREKYRNEIDNVDQYILISKSSIYVEPGDKLEYSRLNFLDNKVFDNKEVEKQVDNILRMKFVIVISGMITGLIMFLLIILLAFFLGRFLITLFTINGIRTFDFKKINKLTFFMMTAPLFVYTILYILRTLQILKIKIDLLIIFFVIYTIYIFVSLYFLKRKYNDIAVVKNIEQIKKILADDEKDAEETMKELERQNELKKEEKRKLKDKNKNKEKDEIPEGV